MSDDFGWVKPLIGGFVIVYWILSKLGALAKKLQPAQEELPPRVDPAPPVAIFAPVQADKLAADLTDLAARSRALGESCRRERAVARFVGLLTDELPAECAEMRRFLDEREVDAIDVDSMRESLEVVYAEVDILIRQRRDPALAGSLADADALADACYAPVVAHARAEGLPLTTAFPAAQIGDFDLSTWTAFIPTRIAPIFLPRDFFGRVSWWPALAHEIGHDFLASVRGLEPSLRAQLGLDGRDAWSAWFEELFCDVFGTLMLGPAFVVTLKEHLVGEAAEMGCDTHPPAQLRILAGCAVLERSGFFEEARLLRGDAFVPPRLTAIVERLYVGPLDGLGGFGLQSISGLDYGPAEHAAARAVREELDAGRVPARRNPRAVIAGAVAAWAGRRDAGLAIMKLALAAIGPREPVLAAVAPVVLDNRWAETVILREILERPRSASLGGRKEQQATGNRQQATGNDRNFRTVGNR